MNRVFAALGAVLVVGLGEAPAKAQGESDGASAAATASAEPAATAAEGPATPPSGTADGIALASEGDADRYEPRWLLTTGAAVHINHVFVAVAGTLRYRETYGRSSSRLLDNLYWEVGGGITTSILVNLFRVHFEWSPLAILKLRATYQGYFTPGFANERGAGLPFARSDLPYGDAVLAARRDETVTAFGHQLLLEPTLQAKVWRLLLLNQLSLGLSYFHGGPDYLYVNATDSLIRRGGFDLAVHEQPIVLFDIHQGRGFHKLYGGAYYELDYAMAADLIRHRVGLMALYSPVRKQGLLFEPTLILLFGMNVVDRNREGTPYFMAVVKTGWDAFSRK